MDSNKIKDIQLIHYPEVAQGETDDDGILLSPNPEMFAFSVDLEDVDAEVVVPNDPLNADYRVVRDWVRSQEKLPFKFDFVDDPEPEKTDEADEFVPAPVMADTEPTPDQLAKGVNLTKKQRLEAAKNGVKINAEES